MTSTKPARYGSSGGAKTFSKFLLCHAFGFQRVINLICNMERPFHLLP